MAIDFRPHAGSIQKLSDIGAGHIRTLRKFIEVRGMKLTEDSAYSSPHCLDATFFGLRLLFRVEITLAPVEKDGALIGCEPRGAIVSYRFTEGRVKDRREDALQEVGVRYNFTTTTESFFCPESPVPPEKGKDCSGAFFGEVFEKLVAAKTVLKP